LIPQAVYISNQDSVFKKTVKLTAQAVIAKYTYDVDRAYDIIDAFCSGVNPRIRTFGAHLLANIISVGLVTHMKYVIAFIRCMTVLGLKFGYGIATLMSLISGATVAMGIYGVYKFFRLVEQYRQTALRLIPEFSLKKSRFRFRWMGNSNYTLRVPLHSNYFLTRFTEDNRPSAYPKYNPVPVTNPDGSVTNHQLTRIAEYNGGRINIPFLPAMPPGSGFESFVEYDTLVLQGPLRSWCTYNVSPLGLPLLPVNVYDAQDAVRTLGHIGKTPTEMFDTYYIRLNKSQTANIGADATWGTAVGAVLWTIGIRSRTVFGRTRIDFQNFAARSDIAPRTI
jgi:hypothetical protein